MASLLTINCPLCYQTTFTSVPSLCLSLISVSTRLLDCPICHEILFGLDKFTIHLFGHIFNQQQNLLSNTHKTSSSDCNSQVIGMPSVLNLQGLNLADNDNVTVQHNCRVNSTPINLVHGSIDDNKRDIIINNNNSISTTNFDSQKHIIKDNSIGSCSASKENIRISLRPDELLKSVEMADYKTVIKESRNFNKQSDDEKLRKNLEPFLKYNTIHKNDVIKEREDTKEKILDVNKSFTIHTSNHNEISKKFTQVEDSYNKTRNVSLTMHNQRSKSDVVSEPFNNTKYKVYKSPKIVTSKKMDICNCSGSQINENIHDGGEYNCVNDVDMRHDVSVPTRYSVTSPASTDDKQKGYVKEMASQAIQTVEESFINKMNNDLNDIRLLKLVKINDSDRSSVVLDSLNVGDTMPSVLNVNEVASINIRSRSKVEKNVECGSRPMNFCDICLTSFPDEQILGMHRQLVHPDWHDDDENGVNKRKSFGCHFCSKSFKMRGSLMVHRRVAHPTMAGLKSHDKTENAKLTDPSASSSVNDGTTDSLSPISDQMFPCSTCSKSFKKEQHLVQHEKTHENKQWECEVCSKTFSTKYFLKKHRRLHTGEMPYSCSTCGKNFTFQQSYHKHLLYHSDEKPYACCDCGRSFKELSTLHNHQRIHTGEKPFSCETCGKCFRQRVSYLVHRRIHTGAMPYKCSLCNRSFRYKVSERTHKCALTSVTDSCALNTLPNVTPTSGNDPTAENAEQVTCDMYQPTVSKNDLILQGISTNDTRGYELSMNMDVSKRKGNSVLDGDRSENLSEAIMDGKDKPNNSSSVQISIQNAPDIFETTDFLSLILSPAMSSPSEHLRNLSLSPNPSQPTWELPSTSGLYDEMSNSKFVANDKSENTERECDKNQETPMSDERSLNDFLYDMQ